MRLAAGAALMLLLSGCAAGPARQASLEAYFDCLRESGGALVSGHRGAPGAADPENSLAAIRSGLAAGLGVLEMDVSKTRDGVLILMHDATLERTTNGAGRVAEKSWAEIAQLRLKREDGALTNERVPRLAEALSLVKGKPVTLTLDPKRVTGEDLAAAVRAAALQNQAALITYDAAQAGAFAAAAPELMLSVSIASPADFEALRQAGVAPPRMLAFTGVTRPDPELFAFLRGQGVEVIFGTLGRKGERLDDQYAADGDLNEYRLLVKQGVSIIATSTPYAAAGALGDEQRRAAACRLPK